MGSKVLTEQKVKAAIKENLKSRMEAVKKKETEIDTKLEEVRQELLKAGRIRDYGGATNEKGARPECRIPVETISRLIGHPVNELMLHFLNGQRNRHESEMVEYGQRTVKFYGPRYEHAKENQFDPEKS